MSEAIIVVLVVALLWLGMAYAGLRSQLRVAREPRKVTTRESLPDADVFLNPVVVITGDRFTVLHNRGMDEQPQSIAFGGCTAFRWDLAIDTNSGSCRVCCWLDGVELWKADPVGVE